MFGQLPTLLFVIPLGVAAFIAMVVVLWARGRLTLPRVVVAAAAAVYLAGIVANTIFPIYLAWPANDGESVLPLNLIPIAGYEVADAVTNILVFVPLGVLLSLMLRRPRLLPVAAWGAAISLAIEVVQFITAINAHGGHIADVNDWLSNTIGGVAGYAVYALARRQPALGQLLDRFRWHQACYTANGGRNDGARRAI